MSVRRMIAVFTSAVLLLLAGVSPMGASADDRARDRDRDHVNDSIRQNPAQIVVTLKQNLLEVTVSEEVPGEPLIETAVPEEAAEAACVATSIAFLLQQETGNVAMFVSLGGVYLANQEFLGTPPGSEISCLIKPEGQPFTYVPLGMLVDNFVAAGGEIVICPLCWVSRFVPAVAEDPLPLYDSVPVPGAVVGDSAMVSELFVKAHKVIDF